MRCGKCGYLNNSMDNYCTSCGEKLIQEKREQQFYNNENMQSYSGAQYGGNPQYNGNPYNNSYPQQSNHGNGKATAGLICGIFSLLCGIFPLAIVAIVLGVLSKNELQECGEPTGKATASLVLGIVSIVAWVVIAVIYIAVTLSRFGNDIIFY